MKIVEFISMIFSKFISLFKKGKISSPAKEEPQPVVIEEPNIIVEEPIIEEPKEEPKPIIEEEVKLLSPILHKRYISIYCIADLSDGNIPLSDVYGNTIYSVSEYSKSRIDMEGTATLPNGKVINVAGVVEGEMRYKVMGSDAPYGVGIYNRALEPWVSLAHQLSQLKEHKLFGRTIVIPSMRGYVLPNGSTHTGMFRVDDTGGGLRSCPYEGGLWRSGYSGSTHGQFDLFIGGPESLYNKLMGKWDSYKEVFVMPRDLTSNEGIQECVNLLLDEGLTVDGILGPKSIVGINKLKKLAGLDEDGVWDESVKGFVDDSLDNW